MPCAGCLTNCSGPSRLRRATPLHPPLSRFSFHHPPAPSSLFWNLVVETQTKFGEHAASRGLLCRQSRCGTTNVCLHKLTKSLLHICVFQLGSPLWSLSNIFSDLDRSPTFISWNSPGSYRLILGKRAG